MGARFVKVWKSGKSAGDVLTFESPAAVLRALTPKRVHQDVVALTKLGLITRAEDGRVSVRAYDVSTPTSICVRWRSASSGVRSPGFAGGG